MYIFLGLPRSGALRAADSQGVPGQTGDGSGQTGDGSEQTGYGSAPQQAQAVILYPESSDPDKSYHNWLVGLTGCMVCMIIIQAGVGFFYFRWRRQQGLQRDSLYPADDNMSTTTVGSALRVPGMNTIEHAMFKPGLSGNSSMSPSPIGSQRYQEESMDS